MIDKLTTSFKKYSQAKYLAKFESFSDKRKNNLESLREFYFTDFKKCTPAIPLAAYSLSSPCLYSKILSYLIL